VVGDGGVRVGDGERTATDARLQRAHGEGRLTLAEYEERCAQVWAAVTRADLDALTADLPPEEPALPAPVGSSAATTAAAPADRLRRLGGTVAALAVAGVALWGGVQVLGGDGERVVFGSRPITVGATDDRVDVAVLFGRAEVRVPAGVRVVPSGTTVFGSVDCEAACAGTGREVAVDVSGAFGSVDIVTPVEAAAGGLDDRDDDREDDDREDDEDDDRDEDDD
jgi:hypothetical protein